MATRTTYFDLTKPSTDDFYDIAIQNANMDIIDAALHACPTASEYAQLPHFYTGSYTGTGSTTTRAFALAGAPKLLLLFRNGAVLAIATAEVPYVDGETTKLSLTATGFSLGGGFCNNTQVDYHWAALC